jgi:hypothetical protein
VSDEGDLIADRYRLIERIDGAAGRMWRGRDELLCRPVAVRLLTVRPGHPGMAVDAAVRARQAVRTAARLHHPHVVTVHDVAEQDGVPAVVMEYVPGRSLATVLATSGPLWPMDVAGIGVQLAAALAEAHRVGVLHRDVRPQHVLLAGNGNAKLAGFGLVPTLTGAGADATAYLAPEVLAGGEFGPACDAFALGATLYAAVNGRPPGRPGPPDRSGPLRDLLSRLLAADPAARPDLARTGAELMALSRDGALWTRPIPLPDGDPLTGVLSMEQLWQSAASAVGAAARPEHRGRWRSLARFVPAVVRRARQRPAHAVVAWIPEARNPFRTALTPATGAAGPTAFGAPAFGGSAFGGPAGGGAVTSAVRSAGPPTLIGAPTGPAFAAPDTGTRLLDTSTPATHRPVGGGFRREVARAFGSRLRSVLIVGGALSVVVAVLLSGAGGVSGAPAPAAMPSAPGGANALAPSAAPSAVAVRIFLVGYYTLLPGNQEAAWWLLSPRYRQANGGFAAYQRFYRTIAAVRVREVTVTGPLTATAVLVFRRVDGTTSTERYAFTLTVVGGQLLIDNARLVAVLPAGH